MKYVYYPAIFKSADQASNDTQKYYLNSIRAYSVTLIAGVGLGVHGIRSKESAIIAALLFLAGIFITIFLRSKKFEDYWYKCRSIAESVKTSTWRFMMRANPYEDAEKVEIVRKEFLQLIRNILKEHKNLSEHLTKNYGDDEQITEGMNEIRKMDLDDRISFYRDYRIDEQRTWYTKKASDNKKFGFRWFITLVVLHCLAILFVLFRIAYPEWSYWPTEIFTVAGSSVLTWIQVKRYSELSAAYSLAAHEISAIRGELEYVTTEERFSQFVMNAENAFSREHTQWIARKDI